MKFIKDRFGHIREEGYKPRYVVVRHSGHEFEVLHRGNGEWHCIGQNRTEKKAMKRIEQHVKDQGYDVIKGAA